MYAEMSSNNTVASGSVVPFDTVKFQQGNKIELSANKFILTSGTFDLFASWVIDVASNVEECVWRNETTGEEGVPGTADTPAGGVPNFEQHGLATYCSCYWLSDHVTS